MTASVGRTNSDPPGVARHAPEDLPEAVADGVAQILGRPRARGWIHLYSAIVAT
ncbi:MAG: rane protein, partial [Mycobacterium sp.]|nr:rane protein [Mycobacterium sp.]